MLTINHKPPQLFWGGFQLATLCKMCLTVATSGGLCVVCRSNIAVEALKEIERKWMNDDMITFRLVGVPPWLRDGILCAIDNFDVDRVENPTYNDLYQISYSGYLAMGEKHDG